MSVPHRCSVAAQKASIPDCLLKKKKKNLSLGELETRCHNSKLWYLGKYHKIVKGLVLREGRGQRFRFPRGFRRMDVFHPGSSLKPVQFLLPIRIQIGRKVPRVGAEARS